MKKYIQILILSIGSPMFAQYGNVGINTDNPTARLEVKTNGNTISTVGFKMQNNTNSSVFNLHDNGYLGINNNAPEAVLHITGATSGEDLLISKPTAVLSFNGASYSPKFQHMRYANAGAWSNANYGGQLFLFDQGGNTSNNTVTKGIYIVPVPANPQVSAGLYLGSNRFNGFSLDRLPTTDLDVGGSIRLREYGTAITAGGACSNRNGEIAYYKGHFYGCHNNAWKQLDN